MEVSSILRLETTRCVRRACESRCSKLICQALSVLRRNRLPAIVRRWWVGPSGVASRRYSAQRSHLWNADLGSISSTGVTLAFFY